MDPVHMHFLTLSAAQQGLLEFVQSALLSGVFQSLGTSTPAATNNLVVLAAAAGGQFEIVRWIVKDSGLPVDLKAQDQRALSFAVESGNFKLVRWLVLDSGQELDPTAHDCFFEKLADKLGFKKIATFLSTVTELMLEGLSLLRLQKTPEIVDAVGAGQLPARYCTWMTDSDVRSLFKQNPQDVSAPTQRRTL